jgi:NDP-sugar pyrophosphorylase family protein
MVITYSKGEPPGTHAYLDYGLLVFRRTVLEDFSLAPPYDMGVVIRGLATDGLMSAMVVDEDFHDVGTPDALAETVACYEGREASPRMI